MCEAKCYHFYLEGAWWHVLCLVKWWVNIFWSSWQVVLWVMMESSSWLAYLFVMKEDWALITWGWGKVFQVHWSFFMDASVLCRMKIVLKISTVYQLNEFRHPDNDEVLFSLYQIHIHRSPHSSWVSVQCKKTNSMNQSALYCLMQYYRVAYNMVFCIINFDKEFKSGCIMRVGSFPWPSYNTYPHSS